MKKKNTNDSFPMWAILLILLLLLVGLYFFFKNEKVKKYRDDLVERIKEKESTINFLNNELDRLRELRDTLTSSAIALWRALKISALILLLCIGGICFIMFKMEFWGAITCIIAIVSFSYYAITIVMHNKIGDFNDTLKTIEAYFIQRKFKKAGFSLCQIEVIEQRIKVEQSELIYLKQQHCLIND